MDLFDLRSLFLEQVQYLSDQGAGGSSKDPTFVFRAFYLLRLCFLTFIFSNCLTIGYASFDAKKFYIDPVVLC